MIADLVLGAILGEGRARLGDGADVGGAVMLAGVDANRMAAQGGGRVDPFLVILDGLVALLLVRGAHVAFAVDHDQDAGHTVVVGTGFQVLEVSRVVGLVLEELVDELDTLDAVLLAGDLGKIEVVDLLGEEGLVQRPLGQRDLECSRLRPRAWPHGPGSGSGLPSPIRLPPARALLRNDLRSARSSFIDLVSSRV